MEKRRAQHRVENRLGGVREAGGGEQSAKAIPVLVEGQGEGVCPHGLVNIHAVVGPGPEGQGGDLRQPPIVRLHHDAQDGDRHPQPLGPRHGGHHAPPVAAAAEGVLLGLGGVVDRHLHLAKGPERLVRRQFDGVAVRGERELDPAPSQGGHDRRVVRMQTVLSGPEIHGTHGQSVADADGLREAQPIDALGVAIAMGTGQVARVGEAHPDVQQFHLSTPRSRGVVGPAAHGSARGPRNATRV